MNSHEKCPKCGKKAVNNNLEAECGGMIDKKKFKEVLICGNCGARFLPCPSCEGTGMGDYPYGCHDCNSSGIGTECS